MSRVVLWLVMKIGCKYSTQCYSYNDNRFLSGLVHSGTDRDPLPALLSIIGHKYSE